MFHPHLHLIPPLSWIWKWATWKAPYCTGVNWHPCAAGDKPAANILEHIKK